MEAAGRAQSSLSEAFQKPTRSLHAASRRRWGGIVDAWGAKGSKLLKKLGYSIERLQFRCNCSFEWCSGGQLNGGLRHLRCALVN